ncbi:MAG TPA: type IV pilus assembly protein PilM [Terriglobia bacterium]|nr:type IV pilus assembly protein PilM [Terriglobia bacterium]
MKTDRDLVGVDIGTSSVKAVQLRKKGREIELVSAGLADLSPDAIVDGAIMDTLSVSAAISKVFHDNHISTRRVATSVSGSAVMVKRIGVTAASQEELAEAVPAEARRQLSSDPAELNLDYQLLGPGSSPNVLDVMLVAARREKVSAYTGVLSQAGKKPQLIDIDGFAVQNAFETGYQPPPDSTLALLNVGASQMNVNIVSNGVPVFARDIPFGGMQYTEALQKALEVSFEEAEKLKRGEEHPKVTAEARDAVLASVTQNLVAEIRGTFNFFRQMTGSAAIDRIYLSGGTARLAGLAERVEQELAIPVEILDPLRGIAANPANFEADKLARLSPQLAVAVGLALRSFDRA